MGDRVMPKIKCTLNNRLLENKRKDQLYQAIMVDLYLVGVMEKEKAELLLGYEIPDYLTLPKKIGE